MAQNVQYYSKGRNGDMVRKHWIETCVIPIGVYIKIQQLQAYNQSA